ncbi:hypothetical protein [Streptomyces sp. TRM49041]|uniref:hypothetical protein n=1 Tax=Streptomyces sp. TRM49041 TaxID=2603216 RepID=UPI00165688A5|nr:hypothetical protein [Streptomyces sp. TRM49041]
MGCHGAHGAHGLLTRIAAQVAMGASPASYLACGTEEAFGLPLLPGGGEEEGAVT